VCPKETFVKKLKRVHTYLYPEQNIDYLLYFVARKLYFELYTIDKTHTKF